MYIFEVGLGVAVVLGLFLAIGGYWLLSRALWPTLVGRAEARFAAMPKRTVLAGAPLLLLTVIADSKLLAAPAPPLRVMGFIITGLTIGFALTGAAGLAARVGQGLGSPSDAGREWFLTLKGGAVLLASCLIPVLGWFVILPILLCGGLGAAALALVRPHLRSAPAPSIAPATAPATAVEA
jgi:hypothetical protein